MSETLRDDDNALLQADLDANLEAQYSPLVLCECFARDGL